MVVGLMAVKHKESNVFVLFQMYSFQYEESETWEVWSNDIDLLTFNDDSGDIVISHIFSQLFDGVREKMNDLKNNAQDQKLLLTTKVNNLLTAFEDYRSNVQTNEEFVKYVVSIVVVYQVVNLRVGLLLRPRPTLSGVKEQNMVFYGF